MEPLRHLKMFFRRRPPRPHHVLRRRLVAAMVIVGIVDVVGTVLMLMFEKDVGRSEIHNAFDAFFFTTVQLLTVSSQLENPVTTPGRIVDIFLELTALALVSGIAGAFSSFFLNLNAEQETS